MQNIMLFPKNILFDLGGVILNLDIPRTMACFKSLAGSEAEFKRIFNILAQEEHFERFERGQISSDQFLKRFVELAERPIDRDQVKIAWNAMLLDLPAQRINTLQKLRAKGHQLFLLSNINEIHLEEVRKIIREQHGALDFDGLFEKTYYSHEIGRRKPDIATYQWLAEDASILAQDTLFVDDNAENIKGAREAGFWAQLHLANTDLELAIADYLK